MQGLTLSRERVLPCPAAGHRIPDKSFPHQYHLHQNSFTGLLFKFNIQQNPSEMCHVTKIYNFNLGILSNIFLGDGGVLEFFLFLWLSGQRHPPNPLNPLKVVNDILYIYYY